MRPSHAMELCCLAKRLRAMFKVIILPSVSCVFFIASRTKSVNSSSSQISQALITVLKIEILGFSTAPFPASFTQSRRSAVAFLLFSLLAQQVTTFLHTAGAGVRERSCMRLRSFTASFQLLSSQAFVIARLWINVQALCAVDEEEATRSSPRSGAHPSAAAAAVKRRRPRARLSSFSAAITPLARICLPSSREAILSSS
mmetsp:Transcript_8403/g.11945  ORF Transcript_8403/g.11945 Transcript_8403/m.11945 type:complete len:200 (+) Transcript_8403:722-1321(+)